MEQKLIEYLRTTYNPTAIILHGSRASGHARLHSDWDFALLYDDSSELPGNGRDEVLEQNIEFTHHQLPVDDVMKEFSVKLQNARVVFENALQATKILQRAKVAYTAPLAWTKEDKFNHSLWMCGRIDGMSDTVEEPLLFEKYAADFYGRITNYWYWAIQDRYPKPIYLAVEEIKVEDPEYFLLIENFALGSREEKNILAKQIYKRCFGKK